MRTICSPVAHRIRNAVRFVIAAVFILTLLPGLTAVSPVHAQGFSSFNARNHPEIRWMTAETAHFLITYPQHLEGIETEAATIAEATYEALSANLDVSFDYKIRIYLSDEDEIVNGFAVPFDREFTNIWVNLNDVAGGWTGEAKWLRKVIAHELAHIFHFKAVKSNIGLLSRAIADPMPGMWAEGLAQYQTERWDAFRGDQLLRTSIYESRPGWNDGTSVRNRGLMYAAGNAQLRYFASTYGDSTLAAMMKHREKPLKGLIRYHDFNKAMKATIGKTYTEFFDEWRRHMNVYYNTMAGHMERSDSLGTKPENIPGLFIQDVRFSPDTTHIAVISTVSAERPFQRLTLIENDSTRKATTLFEGAFNAPVSWSADGSRIAYSAMTRGRYGSLINDVYLIDTESGNRRRVTHTRRASYPVFSADDAHLYYIVNENGTGNIFQLNLETNTETRITSHTGDTQLAWLAVHPSGDYLAFARFDAAGNRNLVHFTLADQTEYEFGNGAVDERMPVWSPDGSRLAYTSLGDRVPNLFVVDPFQPEPVPERVTSLFTGAYGLQWLPPDSLHPSGTLLIRTNDTKIRDSIYRIDAGRRQNEPDIRINPSYTRWTTHEPPNFIPKQLTNDPSLVGTRYRYPALRNLTHVSTVPYPFIFDETYWGFGATTLFMEPLNKHLIFATAGISVPDFTQNSFFLINYTNNTFRPSWDFTVYRNSFTGRIYEDDFLFSIDSGSEIRGTLPLDWFDRPFLSTSTYTRIRYRYTDVTRYWTPDPMQQQLPAPVNAWQTDIRTAFKVKKQKPYAYNDIHPLDGWGLETRVTVGAPLAGTPDGYVRPDLVGFWILPGPGDTRFYLYGRAMAQWGSSLAQDYIGFSRYDAFYPGGEFVGDFLYQDVERVRGYRDYVTGNRLLFGTLEYRIPFADDLQTTILGLISFKRTTLSAFLDAGAVWTDGMLPGDGAVERAGAGFELKNVLSLGGLNLTQSFGFGQPVQDFGTERNQDVYYRIRAVVPF